MTVISSDGRFEWDSDKDKINQKKHGIPFRKILSVFDDPMFLEKYDENHSFAEDRIIGIGSIENIIVVVVVFTERTRVRIISARLASVNERKGYYERIRQIYN